MSAMTEPTVNNIFEEGLIKHIFETNSNRELQILHFTDVYEYEENIKLNYGGAARFSRLVKSLSNENPLIINSGDFLGPSITSNITKGAHMIKIFNSIG